jgi:Kef-type K+ transport system membrane component KefB
MLNAIIWYAVYQVVSTFIIVFIVVLLVPYLLRLCLPWFFRLLDKKDDKEKED